MRRSQVESVKLQAIVQPRCVCGEPLEKEWTWPNQAWLVRAGCDKTTRAPALDSLFLSSNKSLPKKSSRCLFLGCGACETRLSLVGARSLWLGPPPVPEIRSGRGDNLALSTFIVAPKAVHKSRLNRNPSFPLPNIRKLRPPHRLIHISPPSCLASAYPSTPSPRA